MRVCQDLRNGSATVETSRTQKEDRCEPNEYRGVSLHVSEAQHGPFAERSEEGRARKSIFTRKSSKKRAGPCREAQVLLRLDGFGSLREGEQKLTKSAMSVAIMVQVKM